MKNILQISLILLSTLLFMPTIGSTQCLSGTYNLGGTSPDFTTFASVEFALENLGVCGAVTIQVFPGTYNERLDLDSIPGTSATNTVEFVSSSTNVNDVILSVPSEYTSSSLPNFVIGINGADYVTIKGITIKRTGTKSAANAVVIDHYSEHIHFENNVIETRYPSSIVLSSIFTVWVTDNHNNDISFVGNTIRRGYLGLKIEGNSSTPINNVLIQDNIFDNSRSIHLKVKHLNNLTLDRNTFTISTSNNLIRGALIEYVQNGLTITNNQMDLTTASGLAMYNCTGSINSPILIANNMIHATNKPITIQTSNHVNLYHNTLNSTAVGLAGVCIYINNNVSNINIINNNLTSASYCVLLNFITGLTSNYNNLYTSSSTIGRFDNVDYPNLTSFQNGTTQDAQSVNVPITYASSSDLHIDNIANFDNLGTPITGITTDIDGETRSLTSPDIGADEFTYLAPGVLNDLALVSFKDYNAGTLNYICNGDRPLEVIVKNTGVNDITHFAISFYQNNVAQNLAQWTGLLAPNEEDTIIVGTLLTDINSNIGLNILSVNLLVDNTTSNNQMAMTTQIGVGGNFIIGKNNADFETIAEAIAAISAQGICGNVTLSLQRGEYRETIFLDHISGTTDTSWVTFQSLDGDPDGVLINPQTYDSNSSSNTQAFSIANAEYIRFQNLTFTQAKNGSLHSSNYEPLFKLNHSDHIQFLNNKILGQPKEAAISIHGSTNSNYLFDNNQFEGGLFGILVASGNIEQSIIKNNRFTGQSNGFLYLNYPKHLTIEKNYCFSKATPVSGTYSSIGFHLQGFGSTYGDSIIIRDNRLIVHKMFGMRLVNIHHTDIYNNTISGQDIAGDNLIIRQSDHVTIAMNTFHLNSTFSNGTPSTFELDNGNSNIKIFNNSFTNTGVGVAVDWDPTHIIQSDYNNFYAASGNPFFNYNSLANWQLSTKDSSSVLGLPNFISEEFLFIHPTDTVLAQKGNRAIDSLTFLDINTDIQGESRDTIIDIGADEFSHLVNYDVGVVATNKPDNCNGNPAVKVRIKNYGTTELTWAVIEWQVDTFQQESVFWQGSLAPGDTSSWIDLGDYLFNYSGNSMSLWTIGDNQPLNDTLHLPFFQNRMGGDYYIGTDNADFASISKAIETLDSAGICAPTTFYIQPNIYFEILEFPAFHGTSATNTITFESLGDSSNTFIANDNNADFITINGADYLTLRGFSITQDSISSLSFFKGILIQNSSNHLTIENCDISGGIKSLDSKDDYLTLRNNRFVRFPIVLKSDNAASPEVGLLIENNSFTAHPYPNTLFAINLQYQDSLLVTNNTMTQIDLIALQIEDSQGDIKVTNNKIFTFKTGIVLDNVTGTVNNPVLVANNFIIGKKASNTAGTLSGVFSLNSNYVNIFHNTIYGDFVTTSANTFTGIRNLSSTQIRIENNIIGNTGDLGNAIWANPTSLASCNHNVFFYSPANAASVIHDPTQSSSIYGISLDLWQSTYGFDANSVVKRPIFMADENGYSDIADGHLSANTVFPPVTTNVIPMISTDIDGEIRSFVSSTIGADEYTIPTNNAQIIAINPNLITACNGNLDIQLSVANFGKDTLNSLEINWEINGITQTPYNWTGTIPPHDTILITIASYPVNGQTDITVWSSLPNGQADEFTLLDTLSATLPVGVSLNGTYTIGATGADYQSFTQAVNDLIANGICAPVVFNVKPGLYDEHILIPAILGSSAENTITFQSEDLDTASVNLGKDYLAPTSTYQYTIKLEGAEYIRFQYMTIEGAASSYYSVIHAKGGGDSIFINNNRILVLKNGLGLSYLKGIETEGSDIGGAPYQYNHLHITDNTIIGGAKGLDLNANSPTDPNAIGLIIRNNHFINQVTNASIFNFKGAVIDSNLVEGVGGEQGFYLSGCFGVRATNNYIYDRALQGFDISGCDSSTTARSLIANNVISDRNAHSFGSGYGMRITVTHGMDVYHNSIKISGAYAQNLGFVVNNSNDINVKNNVFSMSSGTMMSFTNPINVNTNYNNIHAPNSIIGKVGSTTYNTFANWQSAGYDPNSIQLNPIFLSNSDLSMTNVAAQNQGTALPEIPTDILGTARNTVSPDMGAYEIFPANTDIAVASIDTPNTSLAVGYQTISATFQNFGINPVDSFWIGWSVNDTVQSPVLYNTLLAQSDTTQSTAIASYYFTSGVYDLKIWTYLPNNTADEKPENDTLSLTYRLTGMAGTYYIGGTGDFPDFSTAVDSMVARTVIGEVTMRVLNGLYYEQLTIPNIPGSSSTNTVTFISDAEDTTLAILKYDPAIYNLYDPDFVIKFDGARHIRFKNIQIQTSILPKTVSLEGVVRDIIIEGNRIEGIQTNNIWIDMGTIFSETASDVQDLKVIDNYFIYGRRGFDSNSSTKKDYQFIGNSFVNYRDDILNMNNVQNVLIEDNYFQPNNSGITAIALSQNTTGLIKVNKNYLDYSGVGYFGFNNLMELHSDGTSNQHIEVTNNFFVATPAQNTTRMIYMIGGKYIDVYNNTFVLSGNATSSQSTILHLHLCQNIDVKNNILLNLNHITTSSRLIYQNNGTNIAYSHNILQNATGAIAEVNGVNHNTLSAFQTAAGCQNCLDIDPLLNSSTTPHLTYASPARDAGAALPIVTEDIDGEARDVNLIDIGADEFPTMNNDVLMVSIDSPVTTLTFVDQTNIYATFQNVGDQDLTQLQLNWSVNDTLQTPFNWTGSLTKNTLAPSTLIGNYPFSVGSYQIKVWSSLPNGQADQYPLNDTIETVYTPIMNDVAMISIDSPMVMPLYIVQDKIYSTIKNNGGSALTSAQLNWSVNNVQQTAFNWSGNLMTGDTSASFLMGNYTFGNGVYYIKIWTKLPNGQPDQYLFNDTLNYTFVPKANDASMLSIDAPINTPNFSLQNDVIITFKNSGATALTSATLQWTINDTLQPPFYWTGSLPPNTTVNNLTIGNYPFYAGDYDIKIWTEDPSGQPDQLPANDTLAFIYTPSPFAGVYNVGVTGDFGLLSEAVYYLNGVGLSSSVAFQLASGTHTDQAYFKNIPNLSATDTLLIESATQNSANTTLEFASTNMDNNYVLRFDSTNHVTIRHLTLKSTGTDNGNVIDIRGNSSGFHIYDNILQGNFASSAVPDTNASIISIQHSAQNLTIENNAFNNGIYGMWKGNTAQGQNLILRQNTFSNQILSGIHIEGISNLTINQNQIESNSSIADYNGIFLNQLSDRTELLTNQIKITQGHGLVINNATDLNSASLIANNMIAFGGYVNAGILVENVSGYDLVFNSVHAHLVGNNSKTLAFGTFSNGDIMNNLLVNSAGGYVIYANNTNISNATIDYNNLYTTGANIGFWNSDIDVLSTWKSQSNFGQHSLAEFPNFVSNTNLHIDLNNPHLDGAATPLTQILTDFDGEPRDFTTPDIGADEYLYTNIETWKGEDLHVRLFPNPSKGRFSIVFENAPSQGYRIEVLNIEGKKLVEKESFKKEETFFIRNAGVYLVKIVVDGKMKTFKLVVAL